MLCSRLQTQLLKQSSTFENLRGELINQVQQLQINLTAVKAKLSTINMVKKADFWSDVSIDDLEKIRLELRDIMKYRAGGSGSGFEPKIIDVLEEEEGFVRSREIPKLEGLDLIAYRNRVQKVLTELIEQCEPLRKIKAGKPITESELDTIAALVIAQEPGLNIRDLIEYHPDLTGDLSAVIRTLIGLDADMVEQRFTNFAQNYKLNSIQMRFLDLIKNHIRKYGAIELTKLYEDPFTAFSQEGLDGIFPEHDQADELIDLIESINNLNKEFEKG
jgi:type I restriction enzyme R subunit